MVANDDIMAVLEKGDVVQKYHQVTAIPKQKLQEKNGKLSILSHNYKQYFNSSYIVNKD